MSKYRHLIDPVLHSIVEQEMSLLSKMFQDLLLENKSLGGSSSGFRYQGELFSLLPMAQARKENLKDLDPAIEPAFVRFLKRHKKLKTDMNRIKQGLSVVLNKCRTAQDLRDALPDVIANKIPDIQSIPRVNEEGFLLSDKPVLLEQYRKSMNLALKYSANQLLYR